MSNNADVIKLLRTDLLIYDVSDLNVLRKLVLNADYYKLIPSNNEIDNEVVFKLKEGCSLSFEQKNIIEGKIKFLNRSIRNYLVLDIRNNPIPKSTPLSAFEFVGHNETNVKLIKNSRQVVPF